MRESSAQPGTRSRLPVRRVVDHPGVVGLGSFQVIVADVEAIFSVYTDDLDVGLIDASAVNQHLHHARPGEIVAAEDLKLGFPGAGDGRLRMPA